MIRCKLNFIAPLVPGQRRSGNTCVVDENVEGPIGLQKFNGESFNRVGTAGVQSDNFHILHLLHVGSRILDFARSDYDSGPGLRENSRRLKADAGMASGHDRNLAVKILSCKHFLGGRLRTKS